MSHSEMEEELTCPICMELFRQPRRLPCGHSYCHSCIATMLCKNAQHSGSYLSFSRNLACPECREEISLDFVEGIEAIPLDFKLSKLVELFQFMKRSDDSDPEDSHASKCQVKSSDKVNTRLVKKQQPSTSPLLSPASSASGRLYEHVGASVTLLTQTPPPSVTSSVISSTQTGSGDFSESSTPTLTADDTRPVLVSHSSVTSSETHRTDNTLQPESLNPEVTGNLLSCDFPVNTQTQREGAAVSSTANSPRLSGKNTSPLGDADLTDESSLGAVGGLPLSGEIPSDSTRKRLSTPLDIFTEGLESTLNNSENHTAEKEVDRAQSLPPEVSKVDRAFHKGKHSEINQGKISSSPAKAKKSTNIKKKKGRSWKSLFAYDSTSSSSDDESSLSSDSDKKIYQKPSAPANKKGRLVTRFFKSIILSDSSSSDWSDDNDEEEAHVKKEAKTHFDTKRESESIKLQISNIGPSVSVEGNTVAESPCSSPIPLTDCANRHSDENAESSDCNTFEQDSPSPSRRLSQDLKSQESPSSSADAVVSSEGQIRNSLTSLSFHTEVKEIVPRQGSVSSETLLKEIDSSCDSGTSIVSNTLCKKPASFVDRQASIDSNTHLKETIPSALLTTKGYDSVPDLSKRSGKTNSRLRIALPEESKTHSLQAVSPHQTNLNNLSVATSSVQIAPSYYENIHSSRQVGISELGAVASPSEPVIQPSSPLLVEKSLYENVNSCAQPANARTLYDNISDSDLVQCRQQAQVVLSRGIQGHSALDRSPAEIENLKTGFENMEMSLTMSNSDQNNPDNGIFSPAFIEAATPSPMNVDANPHFFDIESLKEVARTPSQRHEQACGVNLPCGPTHPQHLHTPSNAKEPASFYDNVAAGSKGLARTRNESKQQNTPPMPLHPVQTYPVNRPLADCSAGNKDQQSTAASSLNTLTQLSEGICLPFVSAETAANGTCGAGRDATNAGILGPDDNLYSHQSNDDNNNVNAAESRNEVEEEDDINDEETDPEARMLQPKRKPRSKLRKFITSLLSLSSSSDEDEPYYVNTHNTSSSSKSSDW